MNVKFLIPEEARVNKVTCLSVVLAVPFIASIYPAPNHLRAVFKLFVKALKTTGVEGMDDDLKLRLFA